MNIFTRYCLIGILMMIGTLNAKADHITGGEIYYQYAGTTNGLNNYSVTMKLFMRCNSGRNFQDPAIVSIFNRETAQRVSDLRVPITLRETIQLDTLDPCIGNPPSVCYEIAYYNFTISVPPNVQGYLLVGQVNFRISGITNLSTGNSNVGATYTAEIPGTADDTRGPINSSARFTANDLVVVCAGNLFRYSFAAEDNDKDELRYSFCGALQTGTSGGFGGGNQNPPPVPPYAPVPYGNGFNGTIPLGMEVDIDSRTGVITGVAPQEGVYIVTVCVEERRGNIVFATQRKDIQINITNCSIAGARLRPEYQLCGETTQLRIENQNSSPLIQSYNWQVFNSAGNEVTASTQPVFNYNFTDTGLYQLSLQINRGIACPDSTSSLVRVFPGMDADMQIGGTCFARSTNFSDRSNTVYGRINNWFWDFGESTRTNDTAISRNPFFIYPTLGTKPVQLIINNENGCRDTARVNWDISDKPLINLAYKDTLICPPDVLRLGVTGTGNFTWSPAAAIRIGAGTANPEISPSVTTQYVVTIDQEGCINSDTVTVRVTDRVNLQAMADTVFCLTDSMALRTTTNANTLQWQPIELLSNANIKIPSISVTGPVMFRVTGRISQCIAIDSVLVTPVPYPKADAGDDAGICADGAGVLLNGAVDDGASVQWLPVSGLDISSIRNPLARPLVTTSYVLTSFDNKGCPKPGRDTVLITVQAPINLVATNDTSVVIGQSLQLFASGGTRYEWEPSTGLNNAAIPNPTLSFSLPIESALYFVKAFNNGCEAEEAVRIRVFDKPAIYVPTAFTPNNDGLNDVIRPILAGMRIMQYFRVYNRYGQVVFETTESGKGWDGLLKGKPQPAGAYIWTLQTEDYLGQPLSAKGTTILIR